jgi:serine/threonine-protein kinase
MGEIYRAQDTRLNRFVAIKVMTGSSTGDPDRRRRFIQEAQAASALNHPNIITIHDILADGDSHYMVMEHVQGKTLADLIPKGGLRVPQVLKFAMQMTDALQTAHAAGIVHRDLKPGNVMVTDTGLVKILDFGLAKLTDPGPITQDDNTRTIADAPLTVEGSIIGTVSYMSPEQAQGQKVDTRSDIFSLGVVLYEMITGSRAFQGDTAVATLTAILRDDPRSISEVAPDIPPRLADVVTRCLRKVPDDRFQTMRDVHMALGTLKHESDSGVLYRSVLATQSEMQLPPVKGKAPTPATQTGSAVTPPVEGDGKKKGIMIAAAVAAVLIIGAVAMFMMRSPETKSPAEPVKVAESAPVTVPPPVAPAQPETLTNDGVIQLIGAKVPLDVIYNQMRSAPTNFSMTAAEIARLSKAGVPAEVIKAMQDPKNIPSASAKNNAPKATPVDTAKAGAIKAPEATPTKGGATTPAPAPAPAPEVAAVTPAPVVVETPRPKAEQTKQVVLADGSPFSIILSADIPEDAKPGLQLKFTVARDVVVGDSIVIAKGALVTGQISQGKGFMKKMALKLLTVTGVDRNMHKIRALSSRSNKEPERPVETNVKPKGNKVAADAGFEYLAYVDGDMVVTVKTR